MCSVRSRAGENNTSFECRRAYRRSKIIEVAVRQHNLLSPISECHQHRWRGHQCAAANIRINSLTRTVLFVRFIDFAIYLNLIYWPHLVRNGCGRFALWHIRQLKNCSFTEVHIGVAVVMAVAWMAIATNSQREIPFSFLNLSSIRSCCRARRP